MSAEHVDFLQEVKSRAQLKHNKSRSRNTNHSFWENRRKRESFRSSRGVPEKTMELLPFLI
jgi:hypothetical protein